MTRLDLITKTITEALGYEVAKVTIEGSVADVTTTENENFSVMLYKRKAEQADEPCFSLSGNGIEERVSVHILLTSTAQRLVLSW